MALLQMIKSMFIRPKDGGQGIIDSMVGKRVYELSFA